MVVCGFGSPKLSKKVCDLNLIYCLNGQNLTQSKACFLSGAEMRKKIWLMVGLMMVMAGCSLDEPVDYGESCPPQIFLNDEGYIVNRSGAICDLYGHEIDAEKRIHVVAKYLKNSQNELVDKSGKVITDGKGVMYTSRLFSYDVYKAEMKLTYIKLNLQDRHSYLSEEDDECSLENDCGLKQFRKSFDLSKCPNSYSSCAMDRDGYFFCLAQSDDPDKIVCDGEWVNPLTDTRYCGATSTCVGAARGKTCAAGDVCVNGVCGNEMCKSGQHYFRTVNEYCEDDTVENCGEHGKSCATSVGWESGECIEKACVAKKCKSGYKVSDGQCIAGCEADEHFVSDTGQCEANSVANCGKHDNDCHDVSGWADGLCRKGECFATECSDGFLLDEEKGRCISGCKEDQHFYIESCESDDETHCGSHDNNCRMIAGWDIGKCENKRCVPDKCVVGYHIEKKTEADVEDDDGLEYVICAADDNEKCGEDAHACETGEMCSKGTCVSRCADYEVLCVERNEETEKEVYVCADPLTSPKYCDVDAFCKNGSPCSEGQVCSGGVCLQLSCPDETTSLCETEAGNQCINVKSDNAEHCGTCNYSCSEHEINNAASNECQDGSCIYVCREGYVNIGSGSTAATIECIDKMTDREHCGASSAEAPGTKCGAGMVCVNGVCSLTCQSGLTNCKGVCVNTAVVHATTCSTNSLTCVDGYADCDGNVANGCEVNVKGTDTANCGACNKACAAGQVCNSGTCSLTCQSGLTNCNGTCINVKGTDTANCGACGTKCAAGQVCSSGTCTTSCQSGLTNCKGTCINTGETHVSSCSSSSIACATGYADCDGKVSNGCEVNIKGTDTANCGACNQGCSAGQVCSSGTCSLSCQSGLTNCRGTCINITDTHVLSCSASSTTPLTCASDYADCDGKTGNGCEVNVMGTDVANCGGCNSPCEDGQGCQDGSCIDIGGGE